MTLAADLGATAARVPGHTALVAGGRRMTYAELERAVERFAGKLFRQGVTRGDRVAIAHPDPVATAVALYGTVRVGAAFTVLPARARPQRLESLVRHCRAAALVDATIDPLDAGGGPLPDPPGEDDLASLIYTSGSTGEPKGAAFLHRNMTFVAGSIVSYLGLSGDDRILCPLPLSHTYGLYHLIMAVREGATLVLHDGIAFPGRLVEALEAERITFLPGVPSVWQVLTGLDGLRFRALPELHTLTNAGAALTVEQVASVRETFPGARLFSMYGQTECKRVCYLPPEELDDRPGSVGRAIPGTSTWLAEDGELMVRGPHVMQGYWQDPAGSAAKLPEPGVLRTGDLFRSDDAGCLYFVARKDDIIKSRGEKVAPLEVERVLLRVAGVTEAAVIGRPDPLLGEAVVAHVAGSAIEEKALRRACREHLEPHMLPRDIVVHPGLPRTDSGKVDRAALRDG